MSAWITGIALVCGIWYFFILLVQIIGYTQLYVNTSALYSNNTDYSIDTVNTRQNQSQRFLRHLRAMTFLMLQSFDLSKAWSHNYTNVLQLLSDKNTHSKS